MATLKNVCLSCGDKLQAQGVIVLSVERYRNMEEEIKQLNKGLNLAVERNVELADNPPPKGEKKEQ